MSQSDYQRKFDAAMAELTDAGVSRASRDVPYIRLARYLGRKPRPLYYEPFARIAVAAGVYAAIGMAVFGTVLHSVIESDRGRNFLVDGLTAILSGVFCGIGTAAFYRHVRNKHRLSEWDSL